MRDVSGYPERDSNPHSPEGKGILSRPTPEAHPKGAQGVSTPPPCGSDPASVCPTLSASDGVATDSATAPDGGRAPEREAEEARKHALETFKLALWWQNYARALEGVGFAWVKRLADAQLTGLAQMLRDDLEGARLDAPAPEPAASAAAGEAEVGDVLQSAARTMELNAERLLRIVEHMTKRRGDVSYALKQISGVVEDLTASAINLQREGGANG